MEISKLFGLPAHPLLVHVPIVLVPLVSLGAIAMVVVPPWRERFGWAIVVLAAVALIGVQLSIVSGEQLEDHVDRSAALHRHTEMATSMRPLAALLLLVVLVLVLLDARRRKFRDASDWSAKLWLAPAVGVFVVIVSLGSTVRLAEIGHNGARASWHDVNLDARRDTHRDGDGDSD